MTRKKNRNKKRKKTRREKKPLGTLEKSEETDAGLQEDSLHLETRVSLQKNQVLACLTWAVIFGKNNW